jgi:hypothetical protein
VARSIDIVLSALWALPPDLSRARPTDDHPVVVDSDLPGIEVDGRPLETTDLAAPNPGRQFAQTFSRPTVEGSSSQILEGIAEQARGGRIIELLIMWRWRTTRRSLK